MHRMIESCYNTSWVKLMLKKTEFGSKGMHRARTQELLDNSDGHMLNLEEALTSLEQLPHLPSIENFTSILHDCRTRRSLAYVLRLHACMIKRGLEADSTLGNYLVPMLVEVGSMCDAQQVFDKLLVRNEYSWTSLITGYIGCGELQNALALYHKMKEDSVHSSGYMSVAFLKACSRLNDLELGEEIHAEIVRKGLERNPFVEDALVDMYSKCGSLAKARQLFDKLPFRDAISWNALIAGYAKHGLGEEALNCIEQMQLEGVSPDAVTFACSLKACGSVGAIEKGQEIHAEIAMKGLLERDLVVGSTLVDMYAKCGLPAKAREAFDKLPVRNIVSWTALISGYTENGVGQEALNCFEQMQLEGIFPDAVTFVCSLKACCSIGAIEEGQEIHADIARKGWLKKDLVVGSTLVDMYAKCGLPAKAQEAFDRLPVRNVVLWTVLMAAYTEYGLGWEALNCFEQMQLEGVSLNAVTLVCSLKACGSIGAIGKGQEIHAEIARRKLESDLLVGSSLVDMYAKCGLPVKAQDAFDNLPVRNVVSWTVLISGYTDHGLTQEALNCFEQMRLEGVSPNAVTFVCSLKACGSMGAIDKGHEIHAEITRRKLDRDLVVGNSLVDMYAKCGLLAKAQEVFDKLPVQNAVSWNALIAGYVSHMLGEEALNCFERMQVEGVSPNSITFFCCLKACGRLGAIEKGQALHAEIASRNLETDFFVGNSLVDMYAKCGLLGKAQEGFDKLQIRDEESWSSLIAGYATHGLGEEVLNCFEQMQLEGICPNVFTFVCSLKACGSIGAIDKGQDIHADIARRELFERGPFVGNALVDMYAKCGLLAKAQEVFDRFSARNEVTWNELIKGYANQALGEEALKCFGQMQLEGFSLDAVTFVYSLKACGDIGAIDKGREIHAEIVRKGFLESDLFVGNALVDLYAKCGLLAKAVEMFDKLPVRDDFSWNALITGYVNHELSVEILKCFEAMQLEGVSPNVMTFVCCLKACSSVGDIDKGQEIHAEIGRRKLERDLVIGNALVDMYAKCGLLARAREVFDKLPVHEFSWNALIAGYANHMLGEEALNCFEQMQLEGIHPDPVTFLWSMKACGSIGAIDKGHEIHAEIARQGLFGTDPFVGNALVDMYAKCSLLAKAQDVFHQLPVRDEVSWNSLIAGYANHALGEEALNCFEQMKLEGVSPNAITFVYSIKACGSIGAIDKGRQIHAEIARQGLLESDSFVGNALVDMYAKCGSLGRAQQVFDKLPARNKVTWNALIAGYAHLGESHNVFHSLERMTREGMRPDGVTFLSVLTVCSHTGLVDKGETYFETMSKDYGITPTIEHHTCMVDLLSRAGQFDEVVGMMKNMPFNPNLVVWRTLLGACRKWGNVELGRQAFEHAMQLDEKDATAYVLMSNIYADAHMQNDARKARARVKEQALKNPGQSLWTTVGGEILHSVLAGDTRHTQSQIFMQRKQYIPNSHWLP